MWKLNYLTDEILFFAEKRKRMSPGCSNQDPKQPKVASVDLAGLIVVHIGYDWILILYIFLIIMLLNRRFKVIRDFVYEI